MRLTGDFLSPGAFAQLMAPVKRLTGPDLRGVTRRRTAQWMESQILHPEKYTAGEAPVATR